MELILVVLLLFFPLAGLRGDSNVIGSHEPVKVFVGDDAILPCHLEPPFNVTTLTVVWKRNGTTVHVYRSREDNPNSQDEQFKGRTSRFHDEMSNGNISLKLTNVTENDSGNYSCFVPKLQSQVKRGNVMLIVELKMTENKTKIIDDKGNNAFIRGGFIAVIIGIPFVIGIIVVFIYIKRESFPCMTAGKGRNRQNERGNQEDNLEMVNLNQENK